MGRTDIVFGVGAPSHIISYHGSTKSRLPTAEFSSAYDSLLQHTLIFFRDFIAETCGVLIMFFFSLLSFFKFFSGAQAAL